MNDKPSYEIQSEKIDSDAWDELEDFLKHSKHYLHSSHHNCYVKWEYTANKHRETMNELGLKGITPQDVIYPIEDVYYEYFLEETDYVDKVIKKAVEDHRPSYEQNRWKTNKSDDAEQEEEVA